MSNEFPIALILKGEKQAKEYEDKIKNIYLTIATQLHESI